MNIGIIFFAAATIGLGFVAFLWLFIKPSDRANKLFGLVSYGRPEDHDPRHQKLSFIGQLAFMLLIISALLFILHIFGFDIQTNFEIITR